MMPLGIWRSTSARHHPNVLSQDHHYMLQRHRHQEAAHDDEAEILKSTSKESTTSLKEAPMCESTPLMEEQLRPNNSSKPDLMAPIYKLASSSHQTEKHVSFSEVHVRTYQVILGDNPECSCPLSLGWKHTVWDIVDIDTYETLKERTREQHLAGPLSFARAPLSLHERRLRLRSMGFTENELRRSERKRRIELSLQWAGGQFPKSEEFPYSNHFFLNYVL